MEGLGLGVKLESLSVMRQRPNHLLAMLNGLGLGNVITIFVQIKAFGKNSKTVSDQPSAWQKQ